MATESPMKKTATISASEHGIVLHWPGEVTLKTHPFVSSLTAVLGIHKATETEHKHSSSAFIKIKQIPVCKEKGQVRFHGCRENHPFLFRSKRQLRADSHSVQDRTSQAPSSSWRARSLGCSGALHSVLPSFIYFVLPDVKERIFSIRSRKYFPPEEIPVSRWLSSKIQMKSL